MRWRRVACVPIALGLALLPGMAGHASASGTGTRLLFVAPTGSDTSNTCDTSSKPCATIGHALARSGADAVIVVSPGVYREHGLVIRSDVEIEGSGAGTTILDAGRKGQALVVDSGGSLTLDGMTVRNGNSAAHAGAVENSGTLSLTGDRLVDNSAVDPGGAIVNYTTITELDDDRFIGNSTQSYGGALTNFGVVEQATGDVFTDNFAESGAGAMENQGTLPSLDDSSFISNKSGYAGAIDNSGDIGDLSGDTFWDNNVFGYGGALNNVFGTIDTVTDDTFVDNSVNDSLGQGGAIEQDEGTISTLADDTITGNSAVIGGGIDNEDSSTIASITGVIVAHNVGTEGPNCFNFMSQMVDGGYNLESDRHAACGFTSADHDLIGVSAHLRELGAYGGPTLTEPPWPASPVVRDGPAHTCPTKVDQRGVPRPQGSRSDCGIGAVELAAPHPASIAPASGPVDGGTRLRIAGSGLTLATEVTVGATPVHFHVVGDDAITLTSPPGTGLEEVRVTTPDGRSRGRLTFAYGPPS